MPGGPHRRQQRTILTLGRALVCSSRQVAVVGGRGLGEGEGGGRRGRRWRSEITPSGQALGLMTPRNIRAPPSGGPVVRMAVNHGELPKVHHCDHDISGAGCDKPARLRHQRRAKGFLSRSLQGRRWTRTAGRLTTNHGGCGKGRPADVTTRDPLTPTRVRVVDAPSEVERGPTSAYGRYATTTFFRDRSGTVVKF